LKLIDRIGGEPEAVNYLEEQRSIPKGLKVVDWKPKREGSFGVLGMSVDVLGRLFGDSAGGALAELVAGDGALGRLRLDGLVSVWQGSER
jgi:protease-4